MKKTKIISNWSELVKFVESINPLQDTIVICGWINGVWRDETFIRKLVFTTRPVHVLLEDKDGEDNSVKKSKRKKASTGSSEENIEAVSVIN